MNDGRVVSNFILQALRKKPITINGDGNQTRSFCYVDDLVEGLILMMEQNKMMGPVNIGNPDEITILQLAEEIINLTNSNSKIVFKNLPEDDPVQRQPDIATAKKLLQWAPKVKRYEGLKKTIKYFKGLSSNI
jgi:UDP-glucuronate decarboxylase